MWTLREQERFTRAIAWPGLVSAPLQLSSSDGSPYVQISGIGTQASPITGYVFGNMQDNTTRSVTFIASVSGTLYWNCTASSELNYDFGKLFRSFALMFSISGSGSSTGNISISAGDTVVVSYVKDSSVSRFDDRVTINSLYIA